MCRAGCSGREYSTRCWIPEICGAIPALDFLGAVKQDTWLPSGLHFYIAWLVNAHTLVWTSNVFLYCHCLLLEMIHWISFVMAFPLIHHILIPSSDCKLIKINRYSCLYLCNNPEFINCIVSVMILLSNTVADWAEILKEIIMQTDMQVNILISRQWLQIFFAWSEDRSLIRNTGSWTLIFRCEIWV